MAAQGRQQNHQRVDDPADLRRPSPLSPSVAPRHTLLTPIIAHASLSGPAPGSALASAARSARELADAEEEAKGAVNAARVAEELENYERLVASGRTMTWPCENCVVHAAKNPGHECKFEPTISKGKCALCYKRRRSCVFNRINENEKYFRETGVFLNALIPQQNEYMQPPASRGPPTYSHDLGGLASSALSAVPPTSQGSPSCRAHQSRPSGPNQSSFSRPGPALPSGPGYAPQSAYEPSFSRPAQQSRPGIAPPPGPIQGNFYNAVEDLPLQPRNRSGEIRGGRYPLVTVKVDGEYVDFAMIKKLEQTSIGTYKFQDESKGKGLATFSGNGRPGGNQQRAPNQQMAPSPGKRQANSPPMNQRDEKRRHKACDGCAQLGISSYRGEPTVECSICTGLHHARCVGANPGGNWVCELCCKKKKDMATYGDLSNAYPFEGSLDEALKKANKDFDKGSFIRRGV